MLFYFWIPWIWGSVERKLIWINWDWDFVEKTKNLSSLQSAMLKSHQSINFTPSQHYYKGSQKILFLDKKYNWTDDNISTFLSINKFTYWFGLWLILPLLRKLKLHDNFIAVIGITLTAIGIKKNCSKLNFNIDRFRILFTSIYWQ